MPAPAPAMYWSRPTVHGVLPRGLRAHSSVVVGDLMYVFGGTDSRGCLDTLYILELGTLSISFLFCTASISIDEQTNPK